jgi:hypothetical protein
MLEFYINKDIDEENEIENELRQNEIENEDSWNIDEDMDPNMQNVITDYCIDEEISSGYA